MVSLRRLAIAKNLTFQSSPGPTQAVELIGEVGGGVNRAFTQPCQKLTGRSRFPNRLDAHLFQLLNGAGLDSW